MTAIPTAADVAALARHLEYHSPVLVLTGAGISTASGIPDYRDADGRWKHRQPVQYADFVRSHAVRQRYWARSMIGWPRVHRSEPNPGHLALGRLERAGLVTRLVTQNVDGLHQKAGSRDALDLHGRLDAVVCLSCGHRQPRGRLQRTLAARNPDFAALTAETAPDGDAALSEIGFEPFQVPDCGRCGGVLKPDVVFFGENVPRTRVQQALDQLSASGTLLVVGSSLMVYSGYRFCVAAREQKKPIVSINLGRTRADADLRFKLSMDCGDALTALADRLSD